MKSKVFLFLVVLLGSTPLLQAQSVYFESTSVAQAENDTDGRHNFRPFTCYYMVDFDRKILSIIEGDERIVTGEYAVPNITTKLTPDYSEFAIAFNDQKYFLLRISTATGTADNLLYFVNGKETVHYRGVVEVLYSEKKLK